MKRKCSKTFCFDSKQWAEKVGKDISLTSYFLIKFYYEIEHKLLKITLVQLTLSYIAQQTQLTELQERGVRKLQQGGRFFKKLI